MKRNTNINLKRRSQNSCGFNICQSKNSYSKNDIWIRTIAVRAVESFEII